MTESSLNNKEIGPWCTHVRYTILAYSVSYLGSKICITWSCRVGEQGAFNSSISSTRRSVGPGSTPRNDELILEAQYSTTPKDSLSLVILDYLFEIVHTSRKHR